MKTRWITFAEVWAVGLLGGAVLIAVAVQVPSLWLVLGLLVVWTMLGFWVAEYGEKLR